MDATHSEYNARRRQRPEAIALLAMTMTLSFPTNATFSNSDNDVTRYPSGQFDSNSHSRISNALKLFLIEQKKRHYNTQVFQAIGARLPENMTLLPYQTIDILATLGFDLDYILPTEDDGLSIEFRRNKTYHLIEFLPDGEILFLRKNGKNIDTWDLTVDNFIDILKSELA